MITFAVTALLVAGILGGFGTLPAHAATAPNLGTAAPFAVLAKAAISDSVPASSAVTGNMGLSPATGAAITGVTCAEMTGIIYTVGAAGPAPCGIVDGSLLTTAVNDMSAAYVVAAGTASTGSTGADLGGQTLVPGVYTGGIVGLTGTLTLNGPGVYIFQATTLTTASGSSVVLENGAQACNVFWTTAAVSAGSATLGSTTAFQGTILSAAGIILGTGATVAGAVLAQSAVVMNGNTIAVTPCTTTTTTTSGASAPVNTPGANCASGLFYGYYTNSTTQLTHQFAGLSITAALKLVTDNPPGALLCQTPTTTAACAYLTILTESENGTTLTGLTTDVWSSSSTIAGCLSINTPFTAGAFDSACYTFSHWSDTGSAQRFRSFTLVGDTTFVAVYNNMCGSMPSTDSMISIGTVISPNTETTGYYATLWQNGVMLQSCFSTCSFMVSNGQTYQVAVSDFGAHTFSNWTNGSTSRFITVNVGSTSSTIDLTAIYT